MTTKKLHTKAIVGELLWFLSGDTNVRALQDQKITIWDEWADEDGNLGPVYGGQWRHWNDYADRQGVGTDQITALIDGIKADPFGRRHIVTAWNPTDLPAQKLPPCHVLFQCYVADRKLSLKLYQRSADMFLGVPFNIASYALLTHLIADQCGLDVGKFIWTAGDAHIYINHFEQVKKQLTRKPRPYPTVNIEKRNSIFEYRPNDITWHGYDPHPGIPAPVAI